MNTLLNPDEAAGLIPDYITTQEELNELEQMNIQEALLWLRKRRSGAVLDIAFVHELHRQMFYRVWKWAGQARRSGKNIGIEWSEISTQLAHLLDDVKYWQTHQTFKNDEIAVRFHHRLVQIHVFPNGNGRHARIMTDLVLEQMGSPPFTWGAKGNRRQNYIAALQAADKNDFAPLLAFVRS